ncbi:MAG: hypothetical protein ACKVGZ_00080 [Alphaproteobacteria bacterium]|jgi:hypothetical protein
MARYTILLVSALALMGCDTFKDYRVRVDDPSARSDVRTREAPYYDKKSQKVIYPR